MLLHCAALAASVATACRAPSRPGESPATQAPRVSGTVLYRSWSAPAGSPRLERWYQFIQETVAQRYSGTKVEFEFVPWGQEYLDKFIATVASDSPLDVAATSIIWGRDLWDQGAIEKLNPYIARTPEVAMEQFIPAALFYNQKHGKIYGLPAGEPDYNAIFYRPTFFQEAGLDPSPEALARWSWEDFLSAAQKLTRTEGSEIVRAGFVGPGMDIERFTSWTYSNGGTFYSEDMTRVAFNTEKTAQAVQLQIDIRDKYRIFATRPGLNSLQMFTSGACAMLWAGNWNIGSIMDAIEKQEAPPTLDFNIMAIPRGPQGTRQATTAWVNMHTMPRTSRNKEAAWAVMALLSSAAVAVRRFEILNSLHPRKDFFESAEFRAMIAKIPAHGQQRRIADLGGPYAFIRNAEITRRIMPLLVDAYTTKIPVREALAEAERQANEVMAQVR